MQLIDGDRFLTPVWTRNARQDRDCKVAIDYLISHLRIYLGIIKLGHQLARRDPYRDGHSCTLNGIMSRRIFFFGLHRPRLSRFSQPGDVGCAPPSGGDWTHHTAAKGGISKDMQCCDDE